MANIQIWMKPVDKIQKTSPGKPGNYPDLLSEVKERIRSAQYEALKVVNEKLVGLHWVGHRANDQMR
ncbi:MAG: hypothetical protein KBG63_07690 [Acetobacterium sp.]|nr:hypothetical protein [Acetobacterium sp.]